MLMTRPRRQLFVALAVVCCLLPKEGAQAQPTLGSPVVSPEVGADQRLTVRLKAPGAKEVKVMGDFVAAETAMTKGDDGVWSFTTPALAPGVYGYFFRLEGTRLPDPGNLMISAGATYLKSYAEVNGDRPQFWSVRDVPHGTLHENLYLPRGGGMTRRIVVYTPPGYDRAAARTWPVLYLYHGSGDNETFWTKVGRANFTMDNLLADGKAKPALMVSCFGHTSVPPGPEGGTGGVELYEVSKIEKDIVENVIPLMEKEYHAGTEGKDRAIAGLSMGGYQAVTIGLNNPSRFGYVAGFSAGFRANQDLESNFKSLLAEGQRAGQELKHVWIQVGSEEGNGMINPNRQLDAFLTSKGIAHDFSIIPGGRHSWLTWRGSLRDLLPMLFTDN